MSIRTTRRGNYGPADATSSTAAVFNNTEALILAQAVWEHGANSWQTIAKVLTKHPLISRPKSFFTTQSCHATYNTLMKEAGLERTEANNAVHAPMNHKLAEKHFRTRFEELRGLIIAEETQFKTIVSEIEQIRAGRWDAEITAKITGVPIPNPEPAINPEESSPIDESASQEAALQTLRAEVFDGSDLSGATDTPSSQKSQDDSEAKESPLNAINETEANQEEPRKVAKESVIVSQSTTPNPDRSQVASPQVNSEGDIHAPEEEEEEEVQDIVDEELSSPHPSSVLDSTGQVQATSSAGEIESHETRIEHADGDKEDEEEEKEDRVVQEEEEGGEGAVEVVVDDVEREMDEGPSMLVDEDKTESAQTREASLEPQPASDVVQPDPGENLTESLQEPESEFEFEPKTEAEEEKSEPKRDGEVATSPERAAEEDAVTSGDEPLQATRRSTRRRSSAHLPSMRTVKPRRQKRVSTDTATTPSAVVDDENEVDPSVDANDTDALSEGQSMDEDDEALSPVLHESSVTSRRRDAKRKASAVESIESPREKKRARDDSEPIDEDEAGGPNSRARRRGDRTEEQAALKRFQGVLVMLHGQISQHRNGNIFHNPIKTSEAPDYHEIVKQPTDLKKVKMKIKDGTISNSLEFKREIFHMFANAMMYNRPGSDVHLMAEDMMLESEIQIENFRQTEGLVRGSHRI